MLVLITAWTVAETITPEITDTDYHFHLRLIRTAQAEHPNRPLGLVIGSSRTEWAFQPDRLPEPPAAGGVYWVNASHVESGPILNRVILHRLLRDGVRPAVVVLEVMPKLFVKESERVVVGNLSVAEMPLARSYADRPFGYDLHFLRQRITRAGDIGRVADPFAGRVEPYPRGGSRRLLDAVTPAQRATCTALARGTYAEHLRDLTVRPAADRALRDALRQAADRGVPVVLLRTPEGPIFRSWYDPARLAAFDRYVAGVAAEFGARELDARPWLDEEDFLDSHHVLKRGAEKFTARFEREMATLMER